MNALFEYHLSVVVNVLGLWTADLEFKSAWGFCLYLLNLLSESHVFFQSFIFCPIDLYRYYASYYLS